MSLIDSHCHLPLDFNLTQNILDNAKADSVEKLINIGTSLKDSKEAIVVAENFKDVYATVGVYPHEEREQPLETLKKHLQELIHTSKKVVGIGECGVDISEWKHTSQVSKNSTPASWENGRPIEEQIPLFKIQLELALENNLPIVIHNRNGDDLVLKTLHQFKGEKLRGVAHCFASSWEVAQKYLDLGFYISFSGLITYSSRKDLAEVVKNVPNNRFLVETDAPYLPPQGHRGEKNEPKYVKIVAQKVAEAKGLSFEEISKFSYENTCRVFGLDI